MNLARRGVTRVIGEHTRRQARAAARRRRRAASVPMTDGTSAGVHRVRGGRRGEEGTYRAQELARAGLSGVL